MSLLTLVVLLTIAGALSASVLPCGEMLLTPAETDQVPAVWAEADAHAPKASAINRVFNAALDRVFV